jgi:primosomal protein N' (replication factor Y)
LVPARRPRPRREPEIAAENPVAIVTLDLSTPHLDRTFDYLVPAKWDALAQPGVRMRAGFGGRSVTGFIVGRREQSDHPGKLAPIARVPSGLPLLTAGLWRLAQAVAARQAGVVADVLRLAIPMAHIETEQRLAGLETEPNGDALFGGETPRPVKAARRIGRPVTGPTSLDGYIGRLEDWLGLPGSDPSPPGEPRRLGEPNPTGDPKPPGPRAVWNYLPAEDLPNGLVRAVHAVVQAGRQALVVAPSERMVGRMADWFGPGLNVARLVAGDGPSARLEGYWAAASGMADVLVGTRAAAYAPLARPGLLVLLEDGDPALDEPHAPYPPTRTVMTVRAGQDGCALLLPGLTRSVEAHALIEAGWMQPVTIPRPTVRSATPAISAPTSEDLGSEGMTASTRLPSAAFRIIRDGLEHGPVLVQVPSARHEVFGLSRTAADLGRAFAGVTVKRSAAVPGVIDRVEAEPRLMIATRGAEPIAEGGYAAAVLLDGGSLIARPALDASIDALRAWMNAASLVRAAGRVMLVGSAGGVAVQAFIRWDPAGLAARELAERRELGLPPATKAVVLYGERMDAADLLGRVKLPPGAKTVPGPEQTVVLLPLRQAQAGLAAIRAAVRARSISRSGGLVRVKVDARLD